jgi:hypothetical protein
VAVEPLVEQSTEPGSAFAPSTHGELRDREATTLRALPADPENDEVDRRELTDVVNRLAGAFRSKSIGTLRDVWPTLNEEQSRHVAESFSRFRTVQVDLVADGDTVVTHAHDSKPDTARLHARRRVRMTPHAGPSPPSVEDTVVLSFERRSGGWVITRVE